jgi:hypothetical protein
MLPSTISYSLILGCYLSAIGANCTPTLPPVDDIINGAPPPHIICEEGFEGLHDFIGRDAAKKNCYTVLDAIESKLIRQKQRKRGKKRKNGEKGLFGAVRNRETGEPLNLRNVVDNLRFMPMEMEMNPAAAAGGYADHSCRIAVRRRGNEHDPESMFPPAQLDTTVYFYYWARALDIASQIIDKCFDESSEHRGGQEEDIREIGYGNSKLKAKNWSLPYTVIIGYDWNLRPSSHDSWSSSGTIELVSQESLSDSHSDHLLGSWQDSRRTLQGSWSHSHISLPDTQGYQPHSQAPSLDLQAVRPHSQVLPPNTQDDRPPPGRLRRTCQRIYNSLLCTKHLPDQTE